MVKNITHVWVDADCGTALKVTAYGDTAESYLYEEDAIPFEVCKFIEESVICEVDKYDGIEHIKYMKRADAKKYGFNYIYYGLKNVEFWQDIKVNLGEYNRRQFEECMTDLYRDMSAWANEIYDVEEFDSCTDFEMQRLESAITNCANLVKTFAHAYGIEV